MYWHKRPPQEFNPKKRLGLIHVYTGNGKGKTTSALGIALRAVGHNMKVLIIQFMKGHKDYGEMLIQEKLKPQLEVVQFGTPEETSLDHPTSMDQYLAQQGLEYARRAMALERPDVLILDEVNPAAAHGYIDTTEVLDFIDNAHRNVEIILTGRDAPTAFLNAADLVTVMNDVKHPYDEHDFLPRKGIEH